MIALVDYGAGNLASVRKALAAIGANVWTPAVPGELGRAHGIIVPGVGHFDSTKALTGEWRSAIQATVADGTPLLGICVGLQLLFEGSAEAPSAQGLYVFGGHCFNLSDVTLGGSPHIEHPLDVTNGGCPQKRPSLKVPHVGWNSITMPRQTRLMHGVKDGEQVYFTHSYAAPLIDDTAAICEYGVRFTAAVERDNVAAVQFHPEKSGDVGLKILSNWLNLARRSAGGA